MTQSSVSEQSRHFAKMLALHLHPALRLSALPHLKQTGLLNRHRLSRVLLSLMSATTNISKAQLPEAGTGCGFTAVSLLRVRMREKEANAAGTCPEELCLTSGTLGRTGSARRKVTALLLCQPSTAGCAVSGKGEPSSSSSCYGVQCPGITFFSETTVRPCESLHPWRKATAFLCTTLTFSCLSFTPDFSVKENLDCKYRRQRNILRSLPLIQVGKPFTGKLPEDLTAADETFTFTSVKITY